MSVLHLSNDEKKILVIRRHWWIIFVEALFFIFFISIFISLIFFISDKEILLRINNITLFKSFFSVLAIFIGWILFSIVWVKYYLDVWVITNRRVIDIEQHSFFFRDVSEFRLDRIQDITVEVRGIIPTLLDYGHLHVQTAGKSRDFTFSHTPRPYEKRDIISNASNESLKNRFSSVFDQDM